MSADLATTCQTAWQRLNERMHEEPEAGATLVEYALLLVLVLLVSFGTIAIFGESLIGLFETANTAVESTPAPSGTGTN